MYTILTLCNVICIIISMNKDVIIENKNMPFFVEYLRKQGFSKVQLYRYKKKGFLEQIARGVYKKKSEELDPLLIIKAIQEQLGLPFYVSAHSALSLQGISYYMEGNANYCVFVPSGYRLSGWLKKISRIQFIKKSMFKDNSKNIVLVNGVKVSCIERAFIEMAELVPKKIDFDDYYKVLELGGLGLRADVLQSLLESCGSIKAKRVFLYTADLIDHKWFKKIDLKKIDLGKGDRQISKHGEYSRKYKITIKNIKNDVNF